jgi:molybdopterin molybdotransferase
MTEFLDLLPPEKALEKFLPAIRSAREEEAETVPTQEALGRVLAAPIEAREPLPPFSRSTVDGYAVRARDTYGASGTLPAYLRVVGEVAMGEPARAQVGEGQSIIVHTGGMIPEGADAVVMIEDTQRAKEDEIEVLKAAAVAENVLETGEDVKPGEVVVPRGRRLRAQEIGGLMALGITEVQVSRRPRVGILSTGDEVVPPSIEPRHGQVRDVNSYTLQALVERSGGQPIVRGIIPDQYSALRRAVSEAHREDEIVLVTAGSSVSVRDLTARVFQEIGEPGVLVHGISIRPGKPTILAVADSRPLIGLPGNPVSALVVGGIVLSPAIRRMLGEAEGWIRPSIPARMAINVASLTGREDYLPVRLQRSNGDMVAEPVFGRSNLIFTLVRADGLVRIPPEATGLAAGERVEVQLFSA